MTSMYTKMERIQKLMYREISKGNYEKANKLLKQYVDLSVKDLKNKIG